MPIQIQVISDDATMGAFLDLLEQHFREQFDGVVPFRPAPNWRETYGAAMLPALGGSRHRYLIALESNGGSVDEPSAATHDSRKSPSKSDRDAIHPAGLCAAWWREEPLTGEAVGVISELFVVPEVRRRGVARRLVEDALSWFAECGVGGVTIQTPLSNGGPSGPAVDFWRAMGFAAEALVMKRRNGLSRRH